MNLRFHSIVRFVLFSIWKILYYCLLKAQTVLLNCRYENLLNRILVVRLFVDFFTS